MNTAKQLAAEYGVSERQIYRDVQFANAVDTIARKLGSWAKVEILSGNLKIPRVYYAKLVAMPTEKLSKVFQRIRQGERWRDILGSAFPSRLERVQTDLCKFNADEWDEFTDWLQAVFRSIDDHEQRGHDE